ncbi:uncharacterized protein ACB058_007048 [Synchiropus picturatus]
MSLPHRRVSSEQQEMMSSLDQKEPHLIEEVKEEDVTELSLTVVKVEVADDDDDDDDEEEKEGPSNNQLTQHLKMDAEEEYSRGPEVTPPHPDHQGSLSSEFNTNDSKDWRDSSNTQPYTNSVETPAIQIGVETVGGVKKPLICSGCGKKCSSSTGLTLHLKVCCGGGPKPKPRATCLVCGKQFYKCHLKVHMRIHSGETPFECSECGKCYALKQSLHAHMKVHAGVKRKDEAFEAFECTECGKCFRAKGTLRAHLKIHIGEKPFECSHCGQCFTRRSNLKNHLRIHSGEKPYICSQCGQCFRQNQTLAHHMVIHTGTKPFSCSQCGFCFGRRASLKKHMIIHTGVKPYTCSYCEKCFSERQSLLNHLKKHVKESLQC